MGRGKVELKRIEDKSSRQVTFSKRRSGLMKKARELSILCDVEIALVVFSGRGRLYEYSSGDSLRKILERYQVYKDAKVVGRGVQESKQLPVGHTNLCRGTDLLQMVQRHFEEQKVENLDVTELTQLEHLLDAILSQIRVKKSQLMMKAVTAIQEKEQHQQQQQQQLGKGKQVEEMIQEATADGGDEQQEVVPQQSEDPFGELEELYNYSTRDDTNDGGVPTLQQEDAMFYLMYGGGKV